MKQKRIFSYFPTVSFKKRKKMAASLWPFFLDHCQFSGKKKKALQISSVQNQLAGKLIVLP